MTQAQTPSIREVAQAAGVSVATVSRVLNAKGPVRDETRRRVLDAVARLSYVPHSGARSLSLRRTFHIGVVLPDAHGEFFSEVVRGIDVAARGAGYHLLVSGSHSDLAETGAVLQALHGRIDGLVLMTPGVDEEWLRRILGGRIPAVLLNHGAASREHDSIRVDNRRGAGLAVEHLLDLGHRRIALLAGPPGNDDAAERRAGYRETLAAHRLPLDPALEIAGDFGEASGVRAAAALAALGERPTAVFAANDAMAIGCLSALRERGLEVPRDLSLVGFDDIPVAQYLTPALTTIRVGIADLGGRAMDRLLSRIENGASAPRRHEVIAPVLTLRASTAPPPATDRPGRDGSSSAKENA